MKDLLNERVAANVTSYPHDLISRPNRQKVRQRVRRPQVVPQQELVPVEEGPPKFALDDEEAIQACTIPTLLNDILKKVQDLRMTNSKISKYPILW